MMKTLASRRSVDLMEGSHVAADVDPRDAKVTATMTVLPAVQPPP
jgi:hypothetical protein